VLGGKTVRVKEQAHATSRLPADRIPLLGCRGNCKQHACSIWVRGHTYPALPTSQITILKQRESEIPDVVGNGDVVVVHEQGDGMQPQGIS
jgi:hypothetical protein